MAKNCLWGSLLLSIASIRRKLLKTTRIPKNVASTQVQKVAAFDSDRKQSI